MEHIGDWTLISQGKVTSRPTEKE